MANTKLENKEFSEKVELDQEALSWNKWHKKTKSRTFKLVKNVVKIKLFSYKEDAVFSLFCFPASILLYIWSTCTLFYILII